MEKKIRIIAAVIHSDTNEVEIVVEESVTDEICNIHETLKSRWVDCD
jgi:hypothetical protein